MEVRKNVTLGGREREVIFFTVKYNHFRDTGASRENAVLDREEMAECECALALPDSYTENGEETPLIMSFHGGFGRVSEQENLAGGIFLAKDCIDAGFAALDVCGSEKHGMTMGCFEHLQAAYKAYRYAVKHFNVSDRVMAAGSSMGGQTALNFANMYPSIMTAVGIFCPRLNVDGVDVQGHHCIGTWEKVAPLGDLPSNRDLIRSIFRFKGAEWDDDAMAGFNPHRNRAFVNAEGNRVVMPPCPIKIWQGTADPTVDPVMIEEYVRSVRRGGCFIELHLMDGVVHEVAPAMQQELALWFNRFV